jgi:hypothetical protein
MKPYYKMRWIVAQVFLDNIYKDNISYHRMGETTGWVHQFWCKEFHGAESIYARKTEAERKSYAPKTGH